jgi:flagellar biosynthetic protein FliS
MRGVVEYQAVGAISASNRELVVMLFEAAVRHQRAAQDCFRSDRHNEGRERLRKTREIFAELLAALDHEAAPQLTANLSRLYVWTITRLSRAGFDRDAEVLEGSIRVTRTLRDGWAEAFRGAQ